MNCPGEPDDDRTQLIPRQDGADPDRTIIPNRNPGGFGAAERPLRGRVIGTDQPQPAGSRPWPSVPQTPSQGETIFVTPEPGALPGAKPFDPVVGWLTVVRGPGRGEFRPVYYGQNSIGRDPKQRISLDLGDQKISRDTHAFIIYDEVERKFFIRDNGKSNVVRHNGSLVMMPTEMRDRDEISIGDTTLLFVALCNSSFDWLAGHEPDNA